MLFLSFLHIILIGIFLSWTIVNFGNEDDYYLISYIQSLSNLQVNSHNPDNVIYSNSNPMINNQELKLYDQYVLSNFFIHNYNNNLRAVHYKIYNIDNTYCNENYCPRYNNKLLQKSNQTINNDFEFYGINTQYTNTASIMFLLDETNYKEIIAYNNITKNTKAIVIEAIIYNYDLNTKVISRILHEILPSGGIITTIDVDAIKNIYTNSFFIFYIEIIFCSLILIQFVLETMYSSFSKSNLLIISSYFTTTIICNSRCFSNSSFL